VKGPPFRRGFKGKKSHQANSPSGKIQQEDFPGVVLGKKSYSGGWSLSEGMSQQVEGWLHLPQRAGGGVQKELLCQSPKNPLGGRRPLGIKEKRGGKSDLCQTGKKASIITGPGNLENSMSPGGKRGSPHSRKGDGKVSKRN